MAGGREGEGGKGGRKEGGHRILGGSHMSISDFSPDLRCSALNAFQPISIEQREQMMQMIQMMQIQPSFFLGHAD